MEKKEDRRSLRSRTMLSEALIDLIIEKGYAAITVQDIIDRANVGRTTFYAHFQDKEELLVGNLAGLREFIKEQIELNSEKALPVEFRFEFSLAMLQHIQGHKRLYRAVAHKQSGNIVMHHLQRTLSSLVIDEVNKLSPSKNMAIPQEIAVDFIVNTFFILVSWWMDQSKPGSADEIDRLFHRLTLSGLRELL
jgi:AcrR family transcriptional regulator